MDSGPSIKEMFVNLTGSALDTLKMLKEKGVVLADDATFEKRISICETCPYLISTMGINRCNICGCGLTMKVRLASSECPIGKWKRMTSEEIDRMKNS